MTFQLWEVPPHPSLGHTRRTPTPIRAPSPWCTADLLLIPYRHCAWRRSVAACAAPRRRRRGCRAASGGSPATCTSTTSSRGPSSCTPSGLAGSSAPARRATSRRDGSRFTHGALPHRAPSPRCTADLVHHVWHRMVRRGHSEPAEGRIAPAVAWMPPAQLQPVRERRESAPSPPPPCPQARRHASSYPPLRPRPLFTGTPRRGCTVCVRSTLSATRTRRLAMGPTCTVSACAHRPSRGSLAGPHLAHSHAVHLPRGALLTWCTPHMWGTGRGLLPLRVPGTLHELGAVLQGGQGCPTPAGRRALRAAIRWEGGEPPEPTAPRPGTWVLPARGQCVDHG